MCTCASRASRRRRNRVFPKASALDLVVTAGRTWANKSRPAPNRQKITLSATRTATNVETFSIYLRRDSVGPGFADYTVVYKSTPGTLTLSATDTSCVPCGAFRCVTWDTDVSVKDAEWSNTTLHIIADQPPDNIVC